VIAKISSGVTGVLKSRYHSSVRCSSQLVSSHPNKLISVTQLQALYDDDQAVALKPTLCLSSFKHARICSDLLVLFLRPTVSQPQTENTRST